MTNIAEKVKNIMMDNGLNKVKIHNNDSKCIVVQGKLNTNYVVTFKSKNNENNLEYYTVLKNIGKRTTTIWNNISIEDFLSIIHIAKLYTTNKSFDTIKNTSDKVNKSRHQSIMPIALTIGIALCGVFGIYLGNQIQNLCSKNENIEFIR